MTPTADPKEPARLLRFQQSLLRLALRCQQCETPARGPRSEPSRRLEQLVRKLSSTKGSA